jgi:hypothetical protein
MTSIDELINNPTLTIEWLEPRPGAEADGTKTHAHVTLSATVGDVIRMARAYHLKQHADKPMLSDRELLEEFMVVHWANRKTEPPHAPYPPIGYVQRDNGIRGPGFSSWLEPVYTRPPTTTIPSHDQP